MKSDFVSFQFEYGLVVIIFVKPNKYEVHVHAMMKEDDDNEAGSPLASVTHFELQLPLVALIDPRQSNSFVEDYEIIQCRMSLYPSHLA